MCWGRSGWADMVFSVNLVREAFLPPSGEGAPKGRMRVRDLRDARARPNPHPQPLSRWERGAFALLAGFAVLGVFQRAEHGGGGCLLCIDRCCHNAGRRRHRGLGDLRRRARAQVVGGLDAGFPAYMYIDESWPMFGFSMNRFSDW